MPRAFRNHRLDIGWEIVDFFDINAIMYRKTFKTLNMLDHSVFLGIIILSLGLADYVLTRILIKGSLFEPFRKWLKTSSGSRFWRPVKRKFNELFSCHLCLGAQLSLWVLSLPLHYFAGSPFGFFLKPSIGLLGTNIFLIGSWFLTGMIITGVHYWIWDKTIDKPVPQKAQIPPELLLALSGQKASGDGEVSPSTGINFSLAEVESGFNSTTITLNEFTALFFHAQFSCGNYRCPFARPECIKETVCRFLEGKFMRVMDLVGIGEIPEDLKDRLIDKISDVIDDGISDLRNDDDRKIGSIEWMKEVESLYVSNNIAKLNELARATA